MDPAMQPIMQGPPMLMQELQRVLRDAGITAALLPPGALGQESS